MKVTNIIAGEHQALLARGDVKISIIHAVHVVVGVKMPISLPSTTILH